LNVSHMTNKIRTTIIFYL